MRRVVVIGCPGTGKTIFSEKLAYKTDLPLMHLDYYYHQKEFNYYKDKKAWVKKVKQLLEPEEWIIDGNYQSTYGLRLRAADTIIFLDYPKRISFYRILKRQFIDRNRQDQEVPEDWKEKLDFKFLKLVWHFNKDVKPLLLKELKQNKNKEIIILNNRKQADEFLKSVRSWLKHRSMINFYS